MQGADWSRAPTPAGPAVSRCLDTSRNPGGLGPQRDADNAVFALLENTPDYEIIGPSIAVLYGD